MVAQEGLPIHGEELRRVMRRVPSPVVVVTVSDGKQRRGITIGSMTSVSLDPPLISFNVNKASETHGILIHTERLVVNVLTEHQASLAHRFALEDLLQEEQFAGVPHRLDAHGLPVLDDALAVMQCSVEAIHDASDHSLFIASVEAILHEDREAAPLLYFERTYRSVGDEVKSIVLSPVNRGSSESP